MSAGCSDGMPMSTVTLSTLLLMTLSVRCLMPLRVSTDNEECVLASLVRTQHAASLHEYVS